MAVRTFLDTSILFEAHHGERPRRDACLALMNDRKRFFVASPFLYLEAMPKAIYFRNEPEIEFYRTYFDNVRIWINDAESILRVAQNEAEQRGLAAMDALHVAAAYLAEAEVLYTLEQPKTHPSNLLGASCHDWSRRRVLARESAMSQEVTSQVVIL